MRALALMLPSLLVLSCGGQSPLGPDFSSGSAGANCASGQRWTGGTSESELMNPGFACRSCHLGQNFQGQNPGGVREASKAYFFMGTAYETLQEADLCASTAPTDAVVEILDVNDVVQLTLPINAAGNFRSRDTMATVTLPYKARVRAGGKVNAMAGAQTDGDCNVCHTATGTGGAPGRVMFPL